VPLLLAACDPEPVTGRPPPAPPASPAVSSPGARDAGSGGLVDAASDADARVDARPAGSDAPTTSRDGAVSGSDAPTTSGDSAVSGTDAPMTSNDSAVSGGDATADAALGSDAHPDAAVDLSADVPSSDARTNGDVSADGPTDAVDAAAPPNARAPVIGDLAIDEILANPSGSDLGREWIEIASRSPDPLDLASLHVADTTTDVAVAAGSLGARALLVLGQSADPTKNGGAPVAAAYGTRLILNNEGEQISICLGPCATGVVLDTVAWGAIGAAYDGHALVVDPATKTICPATALFGTAGDFGTPGAPNPPCPEADAGVTDARAANDAGTD